MAKKYDLIERLKSRNERPVVKIDEEHEFTVNTGKTNVLCIMQVVKDASKKDNEDLESDIKMMDKVIKIALGEKAAEYIEKQKMTMAAINDIIEMIMAAILDKDLDDVGEEEKK